MPRFPSSLGRLARHGLKPKKGKGLKISPMPTEYVAYLCFFLLSLAFCWWIYERVRTRSRAESSEGTMMSSDTGSSAAVTAELRSRRLQRFGVVTGNAE